MSTGVKILDLACDIASNERLKFANIYNSVPTGELHQFLREFLDQYSKLATPSSANGAEGLPEPALRTDMHYEGRGRPAYSAEQLRAAVLAERACIIQLCEEEAARWQYPSHGNAAVTMLKSAISARK